MAARRYDTPKRVLDVLAASVLLVITAPLQVGVAVAVAARLGRPVLFQQRRPGKNGHEFTLLKFRSMADPDPVRGRLSDEERLTPLGRFIRATSLDELPGLWNVLRGDMSIVGPRPLLVQYLSLYSPRQARRHEVRPGITGLAQASGRNSISWEEKLELDVVYVENRSLALDARILLMTVRTVLSREGVSADGHATVSEFRGPPDRNGDS